MNTPKDQVLSLITRVDAAAKNMMQHTSRRKDVDDDPIYVMLVLAESAWDHGHTPTNVIPEEIYNHEAAWAKDPVYFLVGTFEEATLFFRSGVRNVPQLASVMAIPIPAALSHLQILRRIEFWKKLNARLTTRRTRSGTAS